MALKSKSVFDIGRELISVTEETPVDIITFAKDYCKKQLYPEQELILKLIFGEELGELDREILDYWIRNQYVPEDVLERKKGLDHFTEVVLVIGRRGSKTFLSSICIAYLAYRLILLGNPQKHYGIERGKEIYIYCIARSEAQTKATIFSDIRNTILGCPWFHEWIYPREGITLKELRLQTPDDKEREKDLVIRGVLPTSPIASIRIASLHSNSPSLRGPAVIACVYSEFAHFLDTSGNQSGAAVYEAVDPSIKTFGDDGLQILESTPWTQTGKFFERYLVSAGMDIEGKPLDKMAYNGNIYFHLPSWEMYRFAHRVGKKPIITFEDVQDKAITNPDSFWTEWGAQFAKTVDAYFDQDLVESIFDPRLKVNDSAIHQYSYYIHCDPSESGANFGVVVGHRERIRDSIWANEYNPHYLDRYLVVIDYVKAFRPTDFPDGKIDYIKIEQEITQLALRFRAVLVSFDQWNSASSIQHIRHELQKKNRLTRVEKIQFTQKSNYERYENLKSAMLQNLVKIPKWKAGDDIYYLMLELKFLQRRNQRVEKQGSGPVQTKDLADCLGQVVWNALGDVREIDNFPGVVAGNRSVVPLHFQGHADFDSFYQDRASREQGAWRRRV